MTVNITVTRSIENLKIDEAPDWELECTFKCKRYSEYFGEYPTGGRQTWIEAELDAIVLDGKSLKDDQELGKELGLSADELEELLDSMQEEACEDYEAGE